MFLLLLHTSHFDDNTVLPFLVFNTNKLTNKIAPKIPNNIPKNPPFCCFASVLIVLVVPFNKILES